MIDQTPVKNRARSTEDNIDLAYYLDVVTDSKWLIAAICSVFLILGACYAFFSSPIYEADMLIQVEDGKNSIQGMLGDAADALDSQTAASAEIEILRSRLVVAAAVDNLRLYITATPKYFPFFGQKLASFNSNLSKPGIFGYGGYAWGAEAISVDSLEVSPDLQGKTLIVEALEGGKYRITHEDLTDVYTGSVGRLEVFNTNLGELRINIASLKANPGAKFIVVRKSRLQTIRALQGDLDIQEKGKQSGVIGAKLQGENPRITAKILNEVGRQYIKQNIERKSEEAERSLEFLNSQLPELRKRLEEAEDRYNKLRNQRGTVDLNEEAKLLLQQSVTGQSVLFDLQQKRRELLTRFTVEHPSIVAIDKQIASVNNEMAGVTEKIKLLPSLQQDVIRLTRDVKVSTDLYATLLNTSQQLQLVKAGRIGNVRLVDNAVVPESPVKPKLSLALLVSLLAGLAAGVAAAFLRNHLFSGIEDPADIEQAGLSVYATIPYSPTQRRLAARVKDKAKDVALLTDVSVHDPALEAMRSLRTTLQFGLLEAQNNVVLFTGPTPGVGKSFLSSNFAAILATASKRVLLIDGDLRKGYLNQYLGYPRANGLSELLTGVLSFDEAIRRGVRDNLDFMPTGILPPNPSELLLSPSLNAVLKRASQEYDIVLIDSPPVLLTTDAAIIAELVGTIFLVVRSGNSRIGEIQECQQRFERVGKSIKGVVFNGVDVTKRKFSYGTKYGRYRYEAYSYHSVSE